MSKDYEKKLIAQILRICEKQYRKGFQHGYYEKEYGSIKEKQVDRFRFEGEREEYRISQHPATGFIQKSIERIKGEINMPDMEELQLLLSKY